MDPFWLELLKQSPSAAGCVISILLFLRAMKDRDTIFLAAMRDFHRDTREDKGKADNKSNELFEQNIEALAKNNERLAVNTDALNDVKEYIRTR